MEISAPKGHAHCVGDLHGSGAEEQHSPFQEAESRIEDDDDDEKEDDDEEDASTPSLLLVSNEE